MLTFILVALLSLKSGVNPAPVRVLLFNAARHEANFGDMNRATLSIDGDQVDTNEFTVCLRLQPRYNTNIRIFDNQDFDLRFINLKNGLGKIRIGKHSKFFDLQGHRLAILKWHHICVSANQDLETLRLAVVLNIDGKTYLDKTYEINNASDVTPFELRLPIILGGAFGNMFGLFGNLADMNIWSRGLTKDEILLFTNMTKDHTCSLNSISKAGKDFAIHIFHMASCRFIQTSLFSRIKLHDM